MRDFFQEEEQLTGKGNAVLAQPTASANAA